MLNIYYKWADTVNSEKLMERVIVRQANISLVRYGTCAIPIFTKLKQRIKKLYQKKNMQILFAFECSSQRIGCVCVWMITACAMCSVQHSTCNCANRKHRTGCVSAIKWNYKLSNKSWKISDRIANCSIYWI